MKKKIVSIAVMTMMTLALMPVIPVHALDITGPSYKLENDVTEEIVINSDQTVTLDLNGHSIKTTGTSAILNKGNLTIIDSGSGGSVTAARASGDTNTNYAAVATTPGSTTTINAGTYESYCWYSIKNLGTMTITGATVTREHETSNTASVIANGWAGGGDDKIDNVLYDETVYHTDPNNYTAVMTINSGTTVIGKTANSPTAVKNDDYSKLTINGGTFKDAKMAVQNNGTATINGGDFSATDTAIYNRKINDDGDKGELVINNGTFKGAIDSLWVVNGASTQIYGGTFNGDIYEQASSTAMPVTEIYGGTFTSTAGTALDVSSYTKTNTTVDKETGTVTTPTVSKITKYVFYKSYPASAPFNYAVTKAYENIADDTILSQGSSGSTINQEVVRNGVDAGNVKFTDTGKTTTSLTFEVADFNAKKSSSALVADGITNAAADNFYASKEFNLDFSAVNFTKPGVFRYKVVETSENKYFTASPVLYFDVWVVRKSKDPDTDAYNEVTISSIIAHTDTDSHETISENYKVNSKTGYLSSLCSMKAMNLTVKHYSLGNQASRTEDFKYTLTLSNVTKGSHITYVTSDEPKTEKYIEASSLDTDASGTASLVFYLKDKQAITFTNISEYPQYTIQSDEDSLKSNSLQPVVKFENYQAIDSIIDSTTASDATTSTYDGNTGETFDTTGKETSAGTANTVYGKLANSGLTVSNLNYSVTDTKETADTTVVFSVYKNGVIPTGIILDVAPYAVVLLAGFFGLIIFAAKRKNNAEDEA